jgi:hypothetical protein
MTAKKPEPSELDPLVHVVRSGITISVRPGFGQVLEYGQELVLTPELRALNPWLDFYDEPDEQIARYGTEVVRPGPWPKDVPRSEPGTWQHAEEREAARKAAWHLPTREARAAALAKVDQMYGPPPTTSRTIATIAGDSRA